MSRLFLGLDSSTQSLTALVIDYDDRKIIYESSVPFDSIFPDYGTENGVLPNVDPTVAHAPPLMWVEALDQAFSDLKESGIDRSSILAISGSGQQHGSVYLKQQAGDALNQLDPARSLKENLSGIFSRSTSPIWMDSSTTAECHEIQEALGGAESTVKATGSAAIERFTGPQIRKFFKQDRASYDQTSHVCLVSSFMASILAGRIAPIDHGDGAGMNLMDIHGRTWHPDAVNATADGLASTLPPLCPSSTTLGIIAPYFTQKYGLNNNTKVMAWSGDNPNSVLGLGLIRPGMTAISLGTSDTYFGIMMECSTDPDAEGHVFGSPTGDYMTLICFKNGSLAREQVKDSYGLDWYGFSNALRSTSPGNQGGVMLPYFEPEIVPLVLEPGVRRFGLSEEDAAANCRAVVEAQMMSMRIHSAWMGERPSKIYVTGGASANREILQIMADVMNCPVYQCETTNSAALGAALRAAHDSMEGIGWDEVVKGFTDPVSGTEVMPVDENVPVYEELVKKYQECEALAG